jgi:hypothetical protein
MITLFLILINLNLTAPATSYCYIERGKPLIDVNILNWASIDYWLKFYEVKEPEKAKRQIRLETANLTSHYCKECNNLFGMKKAIRRKTTAIGREKSMSVYATWQKSIEDYKLWQDYFYKGGDYYEFLNKKYATDIYYVSKLKRL